MRTFMQACWIFDTDVSMHLWEEYCIFGSTGPGERALLVAVKKRATTAQKSPSRHCESSRLKSVQGGTVS